MTSHNFNDDIQISVTEEGYIQLVEYRARGLAQLYRLMYPPDGISYKNCYKEADTAAVDMMDWENMTFTCVMHEAINSWGIMNILNDSTNKYSKTVNFKLIPRK